LSSRAGDDLYLLTYKNTPRSKIVRTSTTQPDLSNAQVVFPASQEVIEDLGAARDALYVQTLASGKHAAFYLYSGRGGKWGFGLRPTGAINGLKQAICSRE